MIEGLKPYSAYRKSPVPWVNAIPAHWRIERGKALFSESLLPVRDGDEIVTCFRDGQVTLRRNRRTSGFMLALHELGYQGVRKGQLVVHAMDAFAGAIGISDSDGKCTPEYIVCNPRSEDVTPAYFSLVLRLAAHQGFILASCPAVRERAPRFRYPHLGAMLLPVPLPDEQAAIVRFLDHANRRIERYIRGKRKLIALLNEQKQAIIHRAVTRGLAPNVPLKDSGVPWLGAIPAHWEAVQARRLFSFVTSGSRGWASYYSDSERGQIFLQSGNLGRSMSLNLNRIQYVRAPDGAEGERTRVQAQDILICITGALTGNVVITDGALPAPAFVNQHVALCRPRSKETARFAAYALHSRVGQTQFKGSEYGGTKQGLGLNDVKSVWLPAPPSKEQGEICAYLNDATQSLIEAISRTEREIALMREYRTRLVSDVVTGQLDVREAARHLPEVEPEAPAAESDADEAEQLVEDADLIDGEAA